MKTCSKCGIEKDASEFAKRHMQCKACFAAYQKAYRLANRERIRERVAAHRSKNRDSINARARAKRKADPEKYRTREMARYKANRDKKLESFRKYRLDNHEAIRERERQYYRDNKSKVQAYREANKDRLREHERAYRAERRASDDLYAFKVLLRTHTTRALRGFGKDTQTERLLGMPYEDFHAIWESRCEAAGLTDDAVIDHIVPLAAAKTKTEAELMSHWSNLQPLTAEENLAKSDNMTPAIERRYEELRAVAWLLDALN